MNYWEYVGRFHPLLVHLPIGILTAVVLMEGLAYARKIRKVKRITRLLLWLALLAGMLAALTGLLHADASEFNESLVTNHQNTAIVLGVILVAALGFHHRKSNLSRKVYPVILLLLLLAVGYTGHTGGTLTYGTGYLELNAGQNLQADISFDSSSRVFVSAVQPVLDRKCVSCHGPTRQKGKLRLDTREYLLTGGKDGSILGSTPAEGEWYRRISLPMKDDDHMPPDGKTQLTLAELGLMQTWLEGGADFDQTFAQLEGGDSLLAVLNAPVSETGGEEKVAPPDTSLLRVLRQAGIVVSFVSGQDGHVSLQCMNVDTTAWDRVFPLLGRLSSQAIELRLPRARFSHEEWMQFKVLAGLERVYLTGSNFSDKEMDILAGWTHLTYLNLVSTPVTERGLVSVSIPSLTHLYLYQSRVTSADFESIRRHFPGAEVDFGGYVVPGLATDTAIQRKPYRVPDK